MNRRLMTSSALWLIVLAMAMSCRKQEEVVFTGNTIPAYDAIPTILVENYVNRLYIDLIGREPTDEEMSADVATLEGAGLSETSRHQIIDKLMFSDQDVPGDTTSYSESYFFKFYSDTKARLLEGTSQAIIWEEYYLRYGVAILDSLNGNMIAYELGMLEAEKIMDILTCPQDLRAGTIDTREMYRRMIHNSLYDQINMNTFNFINASFDGCYYRFPTESEMDQCFAPIEYNGSGVLFGQVITSKMEYLEVLLGNNEYEEGLVRWCFLSLLNREPSSTEIFNLLPLLESNYNCQNVQQYILSTDEYAGF
ncbi:MAG: hypothetical protein JNM00_08385 [Flavobacteriales bacterium]|nr:hypothetical protein [Flavobacteriales bacterium]